MTTVNKETNLVNIGVKIDEASVKATSDAVINRLTQVLGIIPTMR